MWDESLARPLLYESSSTHGGALFALGDDGRYCAACGSTLGVEQLPEYGGIPLCRGCLDSTFSDTEWDRRRGE